MNFTQQDAATALDVGIRTIRRWEAGEIDIPLAADLACAALWHRLKPWSRVDTE